MMLCLTEIRINNNWYRRLQDLWTQQWVVNLLCPWGCPCVPMSGHIGSWLSSGLPSIEQGWGLEPSRGKVATLSLLWGLSLEQFLPLRPGRGTSGLLAWNAMIFGSWVRCVGQRSLEGSFQVVETEVPVNAGVSSDLGGAAVTQLLEWRSLSHVQLFLTLLFLSVYISVFFFNSVVNNEKSEIKLYFI